MTRLLTEGFEAGDALDFSYFMTTAGCSITSARKRSGQYSLDLSPSSNGSNAMAISPALSEFYWRQGMWQNNQVGYAVLGWNIGGAAGGYLQFESGKICLYIGGSKVATGTIYIPYDSQWLLLEVHFLIADSNGKIGVKIDGILDIDYTGDTKPSTGTTIDALWWGSYPHLYLDDLAMNDTNGSVDNSWCGEGHIIALTPNGNGDTNQFTGSDGNSTDNYLLVDDVPSNSDTDYVQDSTIDDVDLYNLSACGLTNVNISRVWSEVRAKDTVAVGGQVKIGVKTHNTEYWSSVRSLTTSYARYLGDILTTNPNTGSPWTTTELDELQVGMKVA